MHKKMKMTKSLAASLMAATVLVPSAAIIAPMSAAAECQVLGETTFEEKAIPWHTCESSPAKQNFAIEDGTFHVEVLVPKGADGEKWDLQFRHRNLNFKSGHTYKVSFKVKGSRAGMELCSKISNIKGDEEYFVLNENKMEMGPKMGGQWGKALKLTTSYQTVEGTFKPTKDLEATEWAFHYAKGTQYEGNAEEGDEIWFDECSIVCETCGADGECAAGEKSYGATNRRWGEIATGMDEGTNFISVNQVGYYPKQKKVAVLGDNQGDVLPNAIKINLSGSYDFDVCDASTGKSVYTGKSTSPESDKDSNDKVCKLDFTEFQTPGKYYIKVGDWRSMEFNIGDNIYEDKSHNMLTNAMNYFYQNRSGLDIKGDYITSGDKTTLAHEGGHKTDTAYVQKIWKNEYASQTEATGTYASSSITANKGWYDAGDHGKYVVNGGIAVWTLQNMYERAIAKGSDKFADGSGAVVIPENGNDIPDVLDECKYELDFMEDMVVQSDEPTWGKYAGMVYHKLHDHKWTGLATKPYDYKSEWKTERIVKPPTFAATLNYAACAAQAARLWKDVDSSQASKYLEAAKTSYQAYLKNWYEADHSKTTHPTLNCECEKEELNETSLYAPMWHAKGGGPYGDNEVRDDAYWAACEIFVSAKELGDSDADTYYDELKSYKLSTDNSAFKVTTRITGGENKDGSLTTFNWGNTASAGSLTLALHKDLLTDSEAAIIDESILAAADTYIKTEEDQGYGIPYLYDGPGYNDPNNLDPSIMIYGYEWGSNSMVINNAIVMAYAYDLTADSKYMSGVTTAMDYLLGTNPLSFSFITGYGSYHEKNPHHRYWSYELDKTLPMAPDGVLSGGPNSGLQDPYVRALGYVPGKKDNPSQRCFVDSIEAWSTNEVTINWNAPLAWIVSFLQDEAPSAPAYGEKGQTPTNPTQGKTDPTQGGANADKYGDANCDGKVDLADVVLVKSYLLNSSKYAISDKGLANADVEKTGNGLNANDAIAIQQFSLKLIDKLPV